MQTNIKSYFTLQVIKKKKKKKTRSEVHISNPSRIATSSVVYPWSDQLPVLQYKAKEIAPHVSFSTHVFLYLGGTFNFNLIIEVNVGGISLKPCPLVKVHKYTV